MTQKDQHDLIDRFILGSITQKEEKRLTFQIHTDDALYKEIAFQKSLLSIYNDKDFHEIYAAIKIHFELLYQESDYRSN